MPTVSRLIAFGSQGFYNRNITLSTIQQNYNLYNDVVALGGWDLITPVNIRLTLNASCYSLNTGIPALSISGFPTFSKIFLTVSSSYYIAGSGGLGGGLWYTLSDGSPGGTGLYTRNTTFIYNSGTIGGGGGGGGQGRSIFEVSYNNYMGGGGGGGGASYGSPGDGMNFAGWTPGASGAGGGLAAGGGGGAGGYAQAWDNTDPANPVLVYDIQAGAGGAGGALGVAGSTGGQGYLTAGGLYVWTAATIGGAAGYSIDGASYCTFTTAGTIAGAQVN